MNPDDEEPFLTEPEYLSLYCVPLIMPGVRASLQRCLAAREGLALLDKVVSDFDFALTTVVHQSEDTGFDAPMAIRALTAGIVGIYEASERCGGSVSSLGVLAKSGSLEWANQAVGDVFTRPQQDAVACLQKVLRDAYAVLRGVAARHKVILTQRLEGPEGAAARG